MNAYYQEIFALYALYNIFRQGFNTVPECADAFAYDREGKPSVGSRLGTAAFKKKGGEKVSHKKKRV